MNKVVSIIAVLALATAAQAAATLSVASAPSSLPGHTIYMVSAHSDTTNFTGFDIDVVDADAELAHVFMGMSVYTDMNGNFGMVGGQVDQDTQVKFNSLQVMSVGARTLESAAMLSATFAFNGAEADPLTGLNLEIVQVVLPDGSDALVMINTLIAGQELLLEVTVPEPASLALLGMGGLGVLLRRKR